MTPDTILKDDLARPSRAKAQEKEKSENQIVTSEVMPHKSSPKSGPKVANEIHLKHPSLLATKYDISELDVNNSVCYAIVCKDVLFYFEDMPPSLPPIVANVLQEYVDVFPQDMPPGLPPIRGI